MNFRERRNSSSPSYLLLVLAFPFLIGVAWILSTLINNDVSPLTAAQLEDERIFAVPPEGFISGEVVRTERRCGPEKSVPASVFRRLTRSDSVDSLDAILSETATADGWTKQASADFSAPEGVDTVTFTKRINGHLEVLSVVSEDSPSVWRLSLTEEPPFGKC